MVSCTILNASQIDTQKWDTCVAKHNNGLIYATSLYLNNMAVNWYGLIVNDYELIYPITVKKKLGVTYHYMPAFTQQLGFIGNIGLLDASIVKALQLFVQYASPYLNFSNNIFANEQQCEQMNNFIIKLNQPYSSVKKNYKKSIAYSLAKANKLGLLYVVENHFEEALSLYQAYNATNTPHVTAKDYTNLKKLCNQLQKQQQLLVRKVIDTDDNLLSITVLLKDNKRFYNIVNVTPTIGRAAEANYFLYDNLLQELSGQAMIFDFEGSDLIGVQKFYEKFGAINQPYFHWHYNLLPKPIRWLKK
jgi:hypothetical protein